MLLVVPKDFKYNWLALDVLNEGLGHLHSDLEEKEPLMVQSGWERDAARNNTGEVGGCQISCIPHPPPSLWPRDSLPTKTTTKKSQPFWVGGSGFWSFPPVSTLSKVALTGQHQWAGKARRKLLSWGEDPANGPAETPAAVGMRGCGQGRGTYILDVIEAQRWPPSCVLQGLC